MKNNKGFTLTEVLLAAMIVGIIGIALAALTTAALREGGVGRSRLMLRNQLSLFLRQLRQDVRESDSLQINNEGSQSQLTLTQTTGHKLGPNQPGNTITYTCSTSNKTCTRSSETVLNYVQSSSGEWAYPFTVHKIDATSSLSSVLEVRLIVGMDSTPPIKEALKETIVLPQGFLVQTDSES